MSGLTAALGIVAPYYNLVLAVIAVCLFIKLLTTRKRIKQVYLLPWKLIFFALAVYILEEAITVLRAVGLLDIPVHINGFFELVIISIFIYVLLLQKEFIKNIKD